MIYCSFRISLSLIVLFLEGVEVDKEVLLAGDGCHDVAESFQQELVCWEELRRILSLILYVHWDGIQESSLVFL